jgi:hypothetical protein
MAPIAALGFFSGWAQRRYARRACNELLGIYQQERSSHPELAGKPLYARIAARHSGGSDETGLRIVRQAEESFADWRFDRDVTLRDVAAYLIIDAYLKAKPGRHSTSYMRNTVVQMIPADL